VVVPVAFTDLQEDSLRNLAASLVQFLEDREHHSGPSVAGIEIRTERKAQVLRLLAGGAKQPLDAFEPSFDPFAIHLAARPRLTIGQRDRLLRSSNGAREQIEGDKKHTPESLMISVSPIPGPGDASSRAATVASHQAALRP
jgi:hypothetical protein